MIIKMQTSIHTNDPMNRCSVCFAPTTQRCSACRVRCYCSRDCQKLDCTSHKQECSEWVESCTTKRGRRERCDCRRWVYQLDRAIAECRLDQVPQAGVFMMINLHDGSVNTYTEDEIGDENTRLQCQEAKSNDLILMGALLDADNIITRTVQRSILQSKLTTDAT